MGELAVEDNAIVHSITPRQKHSKVDYSLI